MNESISLKLPTCLVKRSHFRSTDEIKGTVYTIELPGGDVHSFTNRTVRDKIYRRITSR